MQRASVVAKSSRGWLNSSANAQPGGLTALDYAEITQLINRYAYGTLRPRDDRQIVIKSLDLDVAVWPRFVERDRGDDIDN